MRRIVARMRDESGIALIFALLTLVTLTASVGTVVYMATASEHAGHATRGQDLAFRYAEDGLNEALAIVSNKNNDPGDSTLLPCKDTGGTPITVNYPGGTATYWGCLTDNDPDYQWTIKSVGSVRNPNVVNGYFTRTVGATVTINIPPLTQATTSDQANAWSWLIARGTGQTCDQTIDHKVRVPFFIAGNLCYTYTSSTSFGNFQGDSGSNGVDYLEVQGGITAATGGTAGSTGGSGQSSPLAHEVEAKSGCKLQGASSFGTCNTANRVYASRAGTSPITLNPPVANFDTWYSRAMPGPKWPCIPSKSSGPYPTLESSGNTARDDSAGAANLTPTTSYTCYSNRYGQISWNAGTKTLTVKGTVYIDGDAYIGNGAANVVSGWGTLYLSGSFLMSSGSKLCFAVSSGNCTTPWWWFWWWLGLGGNLIVVADGNGSTLTPTTVPTGDSIYLAGNNQFAGWLYATNSIELGGGSVIIAPMNAKNYIFDSDFIMSSWFHKPSAGDPNPSGSPGQTPPPANANVATDFTDG